MSTHPNVHIIVTYGDIAKIYNEGIWYTMFFLSGKYCGN